MGCQSKLARTGVMCSDFLIDFLKSEKIKPWITLCKPGPYTMTHVVYICNIYSSCVCWTNTVCEITFPLETVLLIVVFVLPFLYVFQCAIFYTFIGVSLLWAGRNSIFCKYAGTQKNDSKLKLKRYLGYILLTQAEASCSSVFSLLPYQSVRAVCDIITILLMGGLFLPVTISETCRGHFLYMNPGIIHTSGQQVKLIPVNY